MPTIMRDKKKGGSINIVNKSDTEAEINIYGEIVEDATDWWTGGEVPGLYGQSAFIESLRELKDKSEITIRINSFGGYTHVAQAMYTQLRALSGRKTVIVDGVAASAAVVVMLSGDVIKISPGALVMIHEPAIGLCGYYDLPALIELKPILEKTKEAVLETYVNHVNLSKEELSTMMTAETWMTGREAVEYGFATELINDAEPEMVMSADKKYMVVNGQRFSVEGCRNIPKLPVMNGQAIPTEREVEKRLRDSGVPKKAATALATEYSALCLRDSGNDDSSLLRDSEVSARLRNVKERLSNIRKEITK